jgi:3-oxoacid CoA-transferase subunit A
VCGIAATLIRALLDAGVGGLEVISNNAGVDGWGLALLLEAGRLRRIILVAFVAGQTRRLRADSRTTLSLNLVGSATLAVIAFSQRSWGFCC